MKIHDVMQCLLIWNFALYVIVFFVLLISFNDVFILFVGLHFLTYSYNLDYLTTWMTIEFLPTHWKTLLTILLGYLKTFEPHNRKVSPHIY